jgi:hypothetical protein
MHVSKLSYSKCLFVTIPITLSMKILKSEFTDWKIDTIINIKQIPPRQAKLQITNYRKAPKGKT